MFIGPPPDGARGVRRQDEGAARRARGGDAARARAPTSPSRSTRPRGSRRAQARRARASATRSSSRPSAAAAASGCRSCADGGELERALKSCSDRGKAAFADARVYLERYVDQPRHIEVQVFCDAHGAAYALGERECSVQRRHQKIVEETPSPAAFFAGADGEARRRDALRRGAARREAASATSARGRASSSRTRAGELFFLEVNARLQVEHPVTEMVTGLDLVELQLRVAAGRAAAGPLARRRRRGTPIEARVYAEDPSKGFIPKPGPIDELVWAGGRGRGRRRATLRVESGVRAGSKVTPFYDPMIAKVVAWGETRDGRDRRARPRARGDDDRAVHDEPRVPAQGPRERRVPRRRLRHELRRGPREARALKTRRAHPCCGRVCTPAPGVGPAHRLGARRASHTHPRLRSEPVGRSHSRRSSHARLFARRGPD